MLVYTHQNHERKSTAFPRGQDGAFDSSIFCCSSALGNPAACRAGPARGCVVPANKTCYKFVPWVNDAGCMAWREVGRWETASNEAAAANGRPFFFFSPTQWLQHPLALLHLPCPPPKRTFDSRASLDHNVGMRVRVCRACRADSQRVAKRTTEWPAQAYTGSPPPLHP